MWKHVKKYKKIWTRQGWSYHGLPRATEGSQRQCGHLSLGGALKFETMRNSQTNWKTKAGIITSDFEVRWKRNTQILGFWGVAFWGPFLWPKSRASLIQATPAASLAQDGPKVAPRWPQMAPTWPKMAPRWFKIAPRWPQDSLRCSRMASKSHQDGHKMAQDATRRPQDRPRRHKMAPRSPQNCPTRNNTKEKLPTHCCQQHGACGTREAIE